MSQLNVLRTVFKQIARVLMIKPVKARVRPPVQLVARRHFRCLCKQGQHVSGRHSVPLSVISILTTRPACEWPPFCAFVCDLYFDHEASM
jgi:hypothetical protein